MFLPKSNRKYRGCQLGIMSAINWKVLRSTIQKKTPSEAFALGETQERALVKLTLHENHTFLQLSNNVIAKFEKIQLKRGSCSIKRAYRDLKR